MCGTVTPLRNRTHVHVIQHPREQRKAIGTLRLVRLGLERVSVEVNRPHEGAPSRLAEAPREGIALLYPSPGARLVGSLAPHERPTTLVVLDGTWHQARTLYRNNPWLAEVPHVALEPPEPSRYRIRREPERHFLSTVEAIMATLGALEPDLEGRDDVLSAFDRMVDAQLERARARQLRERKAPAREAGVPLRGDVLVHAETVGPAGARRTVQLCGVRLATGETFEGLARPPASASAVKLEKMGVDPAALAQAGTEEELLARWRTFLRPGEVLCAWTSRSLDAVAAPADSVLLKGEYCNATRGPAGDLRDLVARHGLFCRPVPFAGRAAACVSQALAVRDALAAGALAPPPR